MSYVNGSGPHVSLTHRSGSPLSGTQVSWTDFNDAQDQDDLADQLMAMHHLPESFTKDQIKEKILQYLDQALFYLFPKGKTRRQQFLIGDIHGNAGESLKVERKGPKAGQWYDFATGEGGDIVDLWGAARGYDARTQFPDILRDMQTWLGQSSIMESVCESPRSQKQRQREDLGSYTGKWDYRDDTSKLIACVYRYDTPKGKEFRPWDVKSQQNRFPDPRPLYNQPGLLHPDSVIVVEGEKCAEALISVGMCATTAMGGANAPLEKTDWSPLTGKHVLLWPDNDAPGQEYASKVIQHLHGQSLLSLSFVQIPEDVPEKWDAADAVAEGRDIQVFLQNNLVKLEQPKTTVEDSLDDQSYFLCDNLFKDTSTMPQDLVSPRLLTPGSLMIFGGAPKVGKTDFLLNWMFHMAAGLPFLGMSTPRPLKIFYLQTEIDYHYIRERVQQVKFDPDCLHLAKKNLAITPKTYLTLNEEKVISLARTINKAFGEGGVDVIVIDPLRNVFDGKSDNDNIEMINFLHRRIGTLQQLTNPDAGIILVHHTKKIDKRMLTEEPFQALSGATSLRGFYTTGVILFRPNEQESLRQLIFELRNGEPLPTKYVDKVEGKWLQMSVSHARTVRQNYGEKCDGERRRVTDVIVTLIAEAAKRGELYTPTQFAHVFENKAGLGGERSIQRRIDVLASNGFIKFNRDPDIVDNPKSKYGIMCVENMEYLEREDVDEETGESIPIYKTILPTHFKKHEQGVILPVENPEVWVYV